MKRKHISDWHSGHNERKLQVLFSVFNGFKTAGMVAKDTLPEGADFEAYSGSVSAELSKLRWHYTHPYLEHRKRKTNRGGFIAYRCSPKGRRICCELYYRKVHGIQLNWNQKYHITCDGSCKGCEFNPTLDPLAREIIQQKDDVNIVWVECDFCHNFRKSVRVTDGMTPEDFYQIKREILTKHIEEFGMYPGHVRQ